MRPALKIYAQAAVDCVRTAAAGTVSLSPEVINILARGSSAGKSSANLGTAIEAIQKVPVRSNFANACSM